MSRRPRVLWADDEPKRMPYEARIIKRAGWDQVWATSVIEAGQILEQGTFDVLLLDQMMPYYGSVPDAREVWGGCLLLRWLAGTHAPAHAPTRWGEPDKSHERRLRLSDFQPLPPNRRMPVMVLSGYYDEDVLRAMREVRPDLTVHSKPIQLDRVMAFLEEHRPEDAG